MQAEAGADTHAAWIFKKNSLCIVLVAALPRDYVMGFGVAVDFAYRQLPIAYCQLLIAGDAERS